MDLARLEDLLNRHVDGALSGADRRELERMLLDSPDARDAFWRFARLNSLIRDNLQSRAGRREAADAAPAPVLTAAVGASAGTWPGVFGWLSQTGPLSYLVAALILAVMLLGAWAYKISHYPQIVEAPQTTQGLETPWVSVGRVTGMKDCRWADPDTQTYIGASVPRGRKYALSAGLMEVTYDTGAKVILEGPCTYQVESRTGGFLSLGKLTAQVEKRRGQRSGVRGQASGPRPSSFILHPSSLFFVRTPTAIVTDLGTEFGVEVSKEGNTISYVFRGSVKVQTVGDDLPSPAGRGVGGEGSLVLQANESARVEKDHKTGKSRIVAGTKTGETPKFARRIYEPPKCLDLLDIVAGGNGTGHRRGCGIDQVTGEQTTEFINEYRRGWGVYRPVYWLRFVDGVFVPDTRVGPVQLDSAGHTFDDFPANTGATWGSLWPRAAKIAKDASYVNWIRAIGNCPQFTPDGRGLLAFNANMGITFDLQAVRRTFADVRPARLAAIAAMADARTLDPKADGLADLWVFVDGRVKSKRTGIRLKDGAFHVDVEIGPDDRFLTLVSTDGGNGIDNDWLLLGDPVLEMVAVDPDNRKEGQ